LEQAWDLSERINDISTWPCTRGIACALLATMDGNFEAALSLAAESARSLAAAGREAWASLLLGGSIRRALLYLGRASEVLSFTGNTTAGGRLESREALYLAASGRLTEARAVLDAVAESRDLADAADQTTVSVLTSLLDAAIVVGHHRVAEAISPRLALVSNMIWIGSPQALCIARSLGDAFTFLGKPELARDYYYQAIEICTKTRFRPELALSRLGLGKVLLGNYPDERTAAFEHLDFALSEFEAMKMQPALEEARRLRDHAGGVSKPVRPSYPDGLTSREVEILRLIATGRSNLQIADELVISFNTVQRHVGNIFAKTGLHNRTEAAAYAHRHELA
jgi:DNA-binding CsgD family transcriptional regulator